MSQRRRRVGAALALAASLALGFAAQSTRWFESSFGDSTYSVGLISAELCARDKPCRSVPISQLENSKIAQTGLAVVVSGVFAALLLLGAAARALAGATRFAFLPKLALAASIFSVVLAAAFLWTAPWTDTMAPGLAAIVFFVGAAIAGATAAVPLGALRGSTSSTSSASSTSSTA